MSKSILERALGNVRTQPSAPNGHRDLLFNLNHWRVAWGEQLIQTIERPFESIKECGGSEYKWTISLGILINIIDAGGEYGNSVKAGLNMSDEEYGKLRDSLTLARQRMGQNATAATKSLTRNLHDRVRQIGR